ncbi:monocarboxylate transporter 12-like [Haliotis cracherodii]|uniref:monocarboxylate transporter 12-like n=1 Tax=Haliotis cracherodii TaxID=6455 RepID=UPI0039EC30E1
MEDVSRMNESDRSPTDESKTDKSSPTVVDTGTKVVVLITCFLVNFLSLGFALGLGVLFVPIQEIFQTSRAVTSLMLSLCVGIVLTGSFVTSPIVQKIKPGNAIILGGAITLTGCIGGSFAPNMDIIIFSIGFVAGIGLSFAHLASYITVDAVLTTRKGLGVSLLTAGNGLGGFFSPMLNAWMLEIYGWRGAFLLLGAIVFNLCVLGFIIRSFSDKIFHTSAKTIDVSFVQSLHLHLFKNLAFVLYLMCTFPLWVFILGENILIVDIGTSRGHSLQSSSFILSAMSIANVAGNLIAGFIISFSHIPGCIATAVSAVFCGSFSLALVYVNDYPYMVTLATFLGIFFGILPVALPVTVLEITGRASYSAALAYAFGIGGIADIVCGPIGGSFRDLTGDYDLLFYVTAGVCSVIAVSLCALEGYIRHNRKRDKQDRTNSNSATMIRL